MSKCEEFTGELAPTQEESIGRFICLCENMKVYMDWNIWDFHRLFFPPIRLKQYRIFTANNRDVGFFTWAQLTSDASDFIEQWHYDPRPYEWGDGQQLWIIDMVCEPEFSSKAVLWIQRDLFTDDFIKERQLDPQRPAMALRRGPDRTVRRIARFGKRIREDS